MHVCGQTLVLIDNDATVSEVNQKLTLATLKYLFYHMPQDRAFCVSTYEHDITSSEEYLNEPNDLVYKADSIEYEPKDSNLTDAVSEVILRWKASDFACRDILVFTDGLEGSATAHEKEELYYLAENSEYPIYVVMLDQDNNAEARKGLSAMAVTSGGKLFETEYPGSEAGVDKMLSENILAAMDEYAKAHWAKYEENTETETEAETEAERDAMENEAEPEAEEMMPEGVNTSETGTSGSVIYEYDKESGFIDGPGALILSAVLIVAGLLVGILGGFVLMKRRRRETPTPRPSVPEEDYFGDYEIKGIDTVYLGDRRDADDTATRLLADNGKLLTLTDMQNGNVLRIMIQKAMTIGRGDCDVVITGDDALSKRHCEIYEMNGNVCVRDLSSANGTKVNNIRITDQILFEGDELSIGARSYIVGFA